MQEKPLTEHESLALISQMIGQARNVYYENGASALLWGITNVLSNVLEYLKKTGRLQLPFNPYYLLFVAVAVQIYFHQMEKKEKNVVTFSDEALYYVWLAFGISIVMVTVVGSSTGLGYYTLPVMLSLFAMPTFISGCIKKYKSMIIGGIICWILSAIGFIHQSAETFLLVAAGAFFAWVVPGLLFRRDFIKKYRA